MPVRNQNWYDLQAGRRYPLDDLSTGIDDTGAPIRDDIIVDCHIKFPAVYGNYAFVSGITVTPNIVTVIIAANSSLYASGGTIIAAISIPKPLTTNTNYPIQGLVPGVAGWLALGAGVAVDFSAKYSKPIQGLLAPRNARPFRELPVKSLSKYGLSQQLRDIVTIAAQAPVVATYTTVTIDDKISKAVILALDGAVVGIDYEPLQHFLGPCGARPESGTCPRGQILTINGAIPDCSGNINIQFTDGLDGYLFEDCGGIAIDVDLGLADVCDKPAPKRGGEDGCIPESSASSTDVGSSDSSDSSGAPESSSSSSAVSESSSSGAYSSSAPCLSLPLCLTLDDIPVDMTTRAGYFRVDTILAPDECVADIPDVVSLDRSTVIAGSVTGVNILTLDICEADSLIGHKTSAVLQLSGGTKRNGGVILNYLTTAQTGGNHKYLMALLDIDHSSLRLMRFNGSGRDTISTASFIDYGFVFDPLAWYVISVLPTTLGPDILVQYSIRPITSMIPSISASVLVTAAQFGNTIGTVGLYTSASPAIFSHLFIEA